MKKTLLIFVLISSLFCIGSCSFLPTSGGTGGTQDENLDQKPEVVWAIVYSSDDAYDSYISSAISTLEGAMENKNSEMPIQQSDSIDKKSSFEIVLGNTKREISTSAAANVPTSGTDGLYVFSVYRSEGDIAICGNSTKSILVGAEWFIATQLDNTPDTLNKTLFVTEAEYAVGGAKGTFHDISELESLAILDSVKINGSTLEGFDPGKTSYEIAISVRAEMPNVEVLCPSISTASITQADEESGRAVVSVVASDGKTTRNYEFNFKRNEYDIMDAKIEKVYGGRDATVVIVHDDGTHDTVDYMVDQFKEHDLVGTLGLITKNLATKSSSGKWQLKTSEVSYWKSVLKTGVFDVASHSHTHTFWGISDEAESGWYLDSSNNLHEYSFEAGRITEEVAGSQEILRMAFPDQEVLAFIKPGFGRVSDEKGTTGMTQISDKAFEIIAEYYIGMRNTGGGVETIPAADTYSIKSHTVRAEDTSATWQGQVNSAIDSNGMIVFLFHTIKENPTGLSARQAETDKFFQWLGNQKSEGTVWNTHLEDAIRYNEEYKYSKLEVIDNGEIITVSLTNELDGELYNQELTVRIPIPTDSEIVTVTPEGGRGVKYEVESDADGRYLLLDIVPNSGTITITP